MKLSITKVMLTRIRLPAKIKCHMHHLWLVSCIEHKFWFKQYTLMCVRTDTQYTNFLIKKFINLFVHKCGSTEYTVLTHIGIWVRPKWILNIYLSTKLLSKIVFTYAVQFVLAHFEACSTSAGWLAISYLT